jgi:hypothetical protein
MTTFTAIDESRSTRRLSMTQRHTAVLAVITLLLASWSGAASAAPTAAQKCEATKNKAAGKKAACLTGERVKEIKGKAPDFSKCSTNLSTAFTNAETRAVAAGGSCPTNGDVAGIQARVDAVYNPANGTPKALTGVRFVDNGDGTVSDTHTGLMWEKKTDDSSIHDKDNLYSWTSIMFTGTAPDGTAFTTFLATLNNCTSSDGVAFSGGFAGHCDWRLPTNAELQTILLAPCGGYPCINQTIFGPTQPGLYWSSITYQVSLVAWYVDFFDGSLAAASKGFDSYVRAVRGGS